MPDKRDDLDEMERRFHAGEAVVRPQGGAAEPSDDDLRGTLLAQRLARRRGYGVPAREPRVRRYFSSWALGLIALLSAWSLSGVYPDLRYWLSRSPPIDAGHLGAYAALEQIPDGAFVRAQGIASPKRGTYSRFFRDHEVFPLIGSRILVDRARAPDPELRGYGFHFAGEGRLSRAGSRYEGVRDQFAQAGELPKAGEVWVLEDGVAPGKGLRTPLEALLWTALCLASLATLAARLVRARTDRATEAPH